MISAVSSFSALTPNTKIIASASDATPVRQIQRVVRRPGEEGDALQSSGIGNSSSNSSADRLTLLGENAVQTGKAYGMEANDLRAQGLKNQLADSSENQEVIEELDVMGQASTEELSEEEATSESVAQSKKDSDGKELSQEEQAEVAKLQSRDTEVRVHEQAHIAASGGLAQGGASYSYQQGPDGKRYAVGGEVSIDTSPASTPEATIQKMQQVKAAALAPASPSSQDRSVAASATQQMAQARQEAAVQPEDEESSNEVVAESASEGGQISPVSNDERPVTVEEMQEKSVKEATSGETSNKVTESGMIEIPTIQTHNNSTNNNVPNNSSPVSRLSMQQLAARTAYGIPA